MAEYELTDITFTGDENLLKVTAEKQKYMANSPMTFNIEKSLILDNGLTKINIKDSNGNSIKEILLSNLESNSSPQFIALPGDYTAIASLEINGAERIESQPFYFKMHSYFYFEQNPTKRYL